MARRRGPGRASNGRLPGCKSCTLIIWPKGYPPPPQNITKPHALLYLVIRGHCTEFDTDRDGEAWLGPLARLIAVHAVAEGANAGRERREGEVVVVPLAKQCHHVRKLPVVDHAFVRRFKDVVRHLSHLRQEVGSLIESHYFTSCHKKTDG